MNAHPASRLFLIVAALGGLAFTFMTPPFRVPDEIGHLWRAVSIAYGEILPGTDARGPYSAIPNGIRMLPFAMGADEKSVRWDHFTNARHLKLAENDRRIAHHPAGYTPVPYLPQIAAALIGRAFDLLPIDLFYLGRLLNLVSFIAIVWLAIRIAPFGKWVFCAAALLPMTLYLAASWSSDAMTIGAAFLFTALVLREGEKRLPLAGALLALCKPAYILLALMAVVQQKKRIAIATLAATGLAATLALATAAQGHTPRSDVRVDPTAQRRCVSSSPVRFISFLASHVLENRFQYPEQMIGRLGMLDIRLPPVIIWSEIALLAAAALTAGGMSPLSRGVSVFVALATAAGIFLLMYVAYSRSCDVLEGVQGRYFIPLLPVALLACGISLRAADRLMPILVPAIAVSANVTGVVCVALRYYY